MSPDPDDIDETGPVSSEDRERFRLKIERRQALVDQRTPVIRTCPKCRDTMRKTYHDSRDACVKGCTTCHDYGMSHATYRVCPGGRTEHLYWTCGCGFAEVTPCADGEESRE